MKSIIKKIALCTILSFSLNMPANQVWYKSVIESTKDFVLEHRNKFIFGTIITAVVGIAAWARWKFWKSLESSKGGISKKDILMTYINVYKPEGEKSEARSNYSEKFQKRKRIPNNNTQVQKNFAEDTKFTIIFNDREIWKEVKNKVVDALFEEIKKKNEHIKNMAERIKEVPIEESISVSQSYLKVSISKSTEEKNKAINDIEKKIVDSFKNFFLNKNIFHHYSKNFFIGNIGWDTTQKFLKILNCQELIFSKDQNQKKFIAQCIKNVFQTYQSWYPEMIKRYIQNKFEVKKQPIKNKEERLTRFSFKNKKEDKISEDNLLEMMIEVPQVESVETILKKLFEEEEKIIKSYNNDHRLDLIIFNPVNVLFKGLYFEKKNIFNHIKASDILWDRMFQKRFVILLKEKKYFRDFEEKKFDNTKHQSVNDIIQKQKENRDVVGRYIALLKTEEKFKK